MTIKPARLRKRAAMVSQRAPQTTTNAHKHRKANYIRTGQIHEVFTPQGLELTMAELRDQSHLSIPARIRRLRGAITMGSEQLVA